MCIDDLNYATLFTTPINTHHKSYPSAPVKPHKMPDFKESESSGSENSHDSDDNYSEGNASPIPMQTSSPPASW